MQRYCSTCFAIVEPTELFGAAICPTCGIVLDETPVEPPSSQSISASSAPPTDEAGDYAASPLRQPAPDPPAPTEARQIDAWAADLEALPLLSSPTAEATPTGPPPVPAPSVRPQSTTPTVAAPSPDLPAVSGASAAVAPPAPAATPRESAYTWLNAGLLALCAFVVAVAALSIYPTTQAPTSDDRERVAERTTVQKSVVAAPDPPPQLRDDEALIQTRRELTAARDAALEAEREAKRALDDAERQRLAAEAANRQAVRLTGEAERHRADRYLSDVSFVSRQTNPAPFFDLLAEHIPTGDQPDFRGLAWYWLWAKSLPTIARAPRERSSSHLAVTGSVHERLALSPDGSVVIVAEPSGIVIRDVATRQELSFFKFGRRPIAVSPDGRRLVARRVDLQGKDDGLQVWALQTGVEIQRLPATIDVNSSSPGWLAFDSTGERVLTAQGTELSVWSVSGGQKIAQQTVDDSIEDAVFVDDATVLAAIHGASLVRWRWKDKKLDKIAAPKDRDGEPKILRNATCALSPDGLRLALNTAPPNGDPTRPAGAAVVDFATGERTLHQFDVVAPGATVERFAFSPDHRRLTALVRFELKIGREERFVQTWDLETGEGSLIAPELNQTDASPKAIAAADDFPLAIALSRDGDRLAVLGARETRILALGPTRPPALNIDAPFGSADLFRGGRGPTIAGYDAKLSPDGRWIALAGKNGVALWDVERRVWGKQNPQLRPPIAFSPTLPMLAAARATVDAHEIVLWNFASDLAPTIPTVDQPTALAFGPGGDVIAVGVSTSPLQVFDVASRHPLALMVDEQRGQARVYRTPCRALAFSADGRRLISAYGLTPGEAKRAPSVRIWDALTGEPISAWPCDFSHIVDLAVSPDDHLVAVAGSDGGGLFDAAGRCLLDRQEPWSSVEFSPDGRTLTYVSRGRLYLYDVRTARFSARPLAALGDGAAIDYFPDGRAIAVARREEGPNGTASSIEIFRPVNDLDLDVWKKYHALAELPPAEREAQVVTSLGRVPRPPAAERFRQSLEQESWTTARSGLRELLTDLGPQAAHLATPAEWRRFIAGSPTAEASYLLGQLHAESGEWNDAAAAFQAALHDDNRFPDAWGDLALVRLTVGDRAAYDKVMREMVEQLQGRDVGPASDSHRAATVLRAIGLGWNAAPRTKELADYLRRLDRDSASADVRFEAQWAYSIGRYRREGLVREYDGPVGLQRVLPWDKTLLYGLNKLASRAQSEGDRKSFTALRRDIAERGFDVVWREALTLLNRSSNVPAPPKAGLPGDWLIRAMQHYREHKLDLAASDMALATAWQTLMKSDRFAFVRRQFTWQEQLEWVRLFAEAEAAKQTALAAYGRVSPP